MSLSAATPGDLLDRPRAFDAVLELLQDVSYETGILGAWFVEWQLFRW
jgi:hypothetical protein